MNVPLILTAEENKFAEAENAKMFSVQQILIVPDAKDVLQTPVDLVARVHMAVIADFLELSPAL